MRNIVLGSCSINFAADGVGSDPMPRVGDGVAVTDSNGTPIKNADGTVKTTPVATVDLFDMLKIRCEAGVTSGNQAVANTANELLIIIHAIEAIGIPVDTSALSSAIDSLSARVADLEAANNLGKTV